jgi:hypothetical protein
LFANGTRNILEAAVSPLLDLFARDNTNDGGGWDVRFHHFSGYTEHGYPRLFKNFSGDYLEPLMDYGGGSGCGAAWIDEPGIPARWNNAPFTADWGREWVYHHGLKAKGATYSVSQDEFVRLPRVTDLDVDANSAVYALSWKGASFTWVGPEVGFVVRMTPKGYVPPALPGIASLSPVAPSAGIGVPEPYPPDGSPARFDSVRCNRWRGGTGAGLGPRRFETIGQPCRGGFPAETNAGSARQ